MHKGKVHKAREESKVHRDRVHRGNKVHKVRKVARVHKEKASRVHKANKVSRAGRPRHPRAAARVRQTHARGRLANKAEVTAANAAFNSCSAT